MDTIKIGDNEYEIVGWDKTFSWYPKRHKFMHQAAKCYIRDNHLKYRYGKWMKPILRKVNK
jgi:hypothetical protein